MITKSGSSASLVAGDVGSVIVLGAGFVGSVIARRVGESRPVAAMSRSTHPELADPGAAARRVILDEVDRAGAVAVINCVGLLRGAEDEMRAANVEWPTWLAQEVLAGTATRFVHLGSAAEYGNPGSSDPISETAEVRPLGPYGTTKWQGSRAVLAARADGLDAVVGRGFNFVGPHLPTMSPLHQFISDIAALGPEGGDVEVWWPETLRDFILLDDLALGVARLALAAEVPDIVNLCSGTGLTFAQIVYAIAARLGIEVTIRSLDRPGIPAVVGDNQRLRTVCAVDPRMSAELLAEHARVGGAP